MDILLERLRAAAPNLLVAAWLAVYLPDIGHGFLRDDFAWIHQSRLEAAGDFARVLRQDNGFYRPVVALSFAFDYALHGLRPFPFALTNAALLLAGAGAIVGVARGLGLTFGAGLFAAALWMFNPHAVPMAVLWISGRTSLLLGLFALGAAAATVRTRHRIAGLLTLAALLSKEEAVLLPLLLAAWAGLSADGRRWNTRAATSTWPSFAALGVYLVLRAQTSAYLPHSAPDFYRPALDVAGWARNVAEYADRAGTLTAAVVLVLALAIRRRPHLEPHERGVVVRGLLWTLFGFGLTVFLPVRSSLYALYPSIGVALAAAALAEAWWREASRHVRVLLVAAGLLAPFVAMPIYRGRAVRWVRPADVSAHVLAYLAHDPADAGTVTVLHDTERTERGLAGAFGGLLPQALALIEHPGAAWIDPPPPGETVPDMPATRVRHLYLREGRLIEAPDAQRAP